MDKKQRTQFILFMSGILLVIYLSTGGPKADLASKSDRMVPDSLEDVYNKREKQKPQLILKSKEVNNNQRDDKVSNKSDSTSYSESDNEDKQMNKDSRKYKYETKFQNDKDDTAKEYQSFSAETVTEPTNGAASKPNLDACSHELFRSYYKTHHEFPEDGKWKTDHGNEYYEPSFCHFRPLTTKACYKHMNLKSVLVIGDSQAQAYSYHAVIGLLKQAGAKCLDLKNEVPDSQNVKKPDVTYFKSLNKDVIDAIKIQARGCRTCRGHERLCWFPEHQDSKDPDPRSFQIHVEYLSMYMLDDPSIKVEIPENASVDTSVPSAANVPEFFFKIYLHNNFPDVIIFFPPLNHEKVVSTAEVVEKIQRLLKFMDTYVPKTTKVYWLPCTAEFENKRVSAGREWINKTYENGMLATDKIYVLNRVMYDELESHLLDPASNLFGFLNLLNVSVSRVDLSTDGVHYNTFWYHIIIRNLLSTMCSSEKT